MPLIIIIFDTKLFLTISECILILFLHYGNYCFCSFTVFDVFHVYLALLPGYDYSIQAQFVQNGTCHLISHLHLQIGSSFYILIDITIHSVPHSGSLRVMSSSSSTYLSLVLMIALSLQIVGLFGFCLLASL